MFNNIDTDGSGSITFEELKTGLTRLGSRLSETEIKQLMDAVSTLKIYLHAQLFDQLTFPQHYLVTFFIWFCFCG